jgi:hypothetical protein
LPDDVAVFDATPQPDTTSIAETVKDTPKNARFFMQITPLLLTIFVYASQIITYFQFIIYIEYQWLIV